MIRTALAVLSVASVVAASGLGSPVSAVAEAPPTPEPAQANPACITYAQEVRTRYPGYDHVVIIKSTCAKSADCLVSSDVAPDPVKVLVPSNAKVEVFTFQQSPASAFTAKVSCKVRPELFFRPATRSQAPLPRVLHR